MGVVETVDSANSLNGANQGTARLYTDIYLRPDKIPNSTNVQRSRPRRETARRGNGAETGTTTFIVWIQNFEYSGSF